MVTAPNSTFGWFLDPYHLHEFRYFSGGIPTKLVRDAGLESFDPPPDIPLPGPPTRAARTAPRSSGPADMRRADDAEREAPYDQRTACRKATNAIIRFGGAD
jgi:hypothetical protein